MSLLNRWLGLETENWPPDRPPVYTCNTLDEYMNAAAWDMKLHGLKGRSDEAAELFDSLLALGEGDMTECVEVMLGFPELTSLVCARQDDLAERGISVAGIHARMEAARILRAAALRDTPSHLSPDVSNDM